MPRSADLASRGRRRRATVRGRLNWVCIDRQSSLDDDELALEATLEAHGCRISAMGVY
jgi:hypothetical protein